MSDYPQDLRYSTDHEWVRLDGRRARVGITSYAQEALGDIVFVSLPAEGDAVSAGAECGEIESTKSVSPLLSPVPGVVVAVNPDLDGSPELVNSDPYGAGWMVEVEVEDEAVLDALMTAEQYAAQLG
ncbi:MAG: glycine cleavage system protein GcvH [Kineosporiaceae bacterium]|nr:glycine cleavage system protein GcvH [Kineosporiaceae bacterium]MBK7624771.1 glycine cleavage system protein GcvH [Kineosporiaceae bacterium]MBK8076852.1 glycine cleavage system protein GcvH [Kineosporiaceae bacterium]